VSCPPLLKSCSSLKPWANASGNPDYVRIVKGSHRESVGKGDSGSWIGEHPWEKRDPNLVAQFALLLSTSPLALPGSPTSTPLSWLRPDLPPAGGEGRRSSEAGDGGEVSKRVAALEAFFDTRAPEESQVEDAIGGRRSEMARPPTGGGITSRAPRRDLASFPRRFQFTYLQRLYPGAATSGEYPQRLVIIRRNETHRHGHPSFIPENLDGGAIDQ